MGKNSFEQICINFVNEKVRQFTTNRLIIEEIDWYKFEGLEIPQIDFLDNQNVIGKQSCMLISMNLNNLKYFLDLLENGVFSSLEDESKKRVPSSKNLMQTIRNICCQKSSFSYPKLKRDDAMQCHEYCFIIRHFSQDVCYSSVCKHE